MFIFLNKGVSDIDTLEQSCFKIISFVGGARSKYIEAVREAKKGNYDLANNFIKEGDNFFTQGHKAHNELITLSAQGNLEELNLLLIHAEDQLMSAETIKIFAEEFIEVYKKINTL
ncbi:PTS lactose/cellobiose transporter subunit IIA [Clostridium botulinum]|uniref:PTS lactose/cellobiose transporter subunit IIA n=1 Tax=Clostridium botulinum TaxID=1491 RepID=UPI000A538C04|nr:PTS lactose/cellobiose transporter subunit IIA [Clostridium botulinum]